MGPQRPACAGGRDLPDFVRYQFKVGDNIGVGDLKRIDDHERRAEAAEKGMARPFIEAMPHSYDTQLGRWFKDGRSCRAASGRRSP